MPSLDLGLRHFYGSLRQPAARWIRFFLLSTLVGIAAGLSAKLLESVVHHGAEQLVGQFTHVAGANVAVFKWEVLLLPALGGLVSGVMVRFLAPGSGRQGTELYAYAFHRRMGELELRGPTVKATAAAAVISCGGSTGPEGPICALGAGIGSAVGKWFSVTPRERRILLVAGCAAGVGSIFQCPLGGALFAAGALYRDPDFESDAIVPSFIASVVGFSAYMIFHGTGETLLAGANRLRFSSPVELIPYLVLGPVCGLVCILLSTALRVVSQRLTPAMRLPAWLTPVVGGIGTGALACILPQIMDPRYRFIQNSMDGSIFQDVQAVSPWWWVGLFGGVIVLKCLATAFTVGTGAAGGTLQPAVFLGGVTGAFVGALIDAIAPDLMPQPLRQALVPVGMGGVLAATMRTPLAAIVMTTEMTGGYGLIVPLMLVCITSYVIGRRWGLNDEQVRTAADSPAHAADPIVHMLESWKVRDLMERDWHESVAPDTPLGELVQKMQPGTRPMFAVLDNGRLAGLISVSDILPLMDEPALAHAVIAADIMTERIWSLAPDEDLYHALNEFRRAQHDVLPVVSRDRQPRWLGMLTRKRVYESLQKQFAETQQMTLHEHGGLAAIEQEGQLHQLMMAVAPIRTKQVQRLMVPLDAVGRSLREIDFRGRFGVQVVAIELPDGAVQFPPDPNMPLQSSHRLVAVIAEPAAKPAEPST